MSWSCVEEAEICILGLFLPSAGEERFLEEVPSHGTSSHSP